MVSSVAGLILSHIWLVTDRGTTAQSPFLRNVPGEAACVRAVGGRGGGGAAGAAGAGAEQGEEFLEQVWSSALIQTRPNKLSTTDCCPKPLPCIRVEPRTLNTSLPRSYTFTLHWGSLNALKLKYTHMGLER